MKTAIALLVCIVSLPLLRAQSTSGVASREILTAQDSRDVGALRGFLLDRDSSIRARAAFAAGSVQDTALVPLLENSLHDEIADVRRSCAFALGQMNFSIDSVGRHGISKSLVGQLKSEKEERVAIRIIEALGKTGDPASLDRLVDVVDSVASTLMRAEVSLSIGRYAYRGIKSPRATAFAVKALSDGGGWKAAYALFRIGDNDLLAPHATDIVRAASSHDPDVRMYIASALARTLLPTSDPGAILKLAGFDPDWRVRVNALKALQPFTAHDQSRAMGVLLRAVDDSCEHVSITAISVIGTIDSAIASEHHIAQKLEQVVPNESGQYSRGKRREAMIAIARLKGAETLHQLKGWVNDGVVSRTSYIEAIANIPTDEALQELTREAGTSDSQIQLAILEGMLKASSLRRPSAKQVHALRSIFMDALASADIAVITTAAGALSDSLFASSDCVPSLLDALMRSRAAGDDEPMIAIMQSLAVLKDKRAIPLLQSILQDTSFTVALEASNALQKIVGDRYVKQPLLRQAPGHTEADWTLLDWVRKHPVVAISTSRGPVTFELLPDEAPFTCISFASLIKKGYFDGLTFHRVVPNFVIQGGDPQGNGWGGPGYAIRSEFGYEHYTRGVVGMASSGKDTEGSQFFVTHSNQPHLDGRYTIFGRVISGMDVVDLIQVGDTIRTMTFVERVGQRRED